MFQKVHLIQSYEIVQIYHYNIYDQLLIYQHIIHKRDSQEIHSTPNRENYPQILQKFPLKLHIYMNQDNQQKQRDIEKKIHKTKIYIIVMGFKQCGKTQFIESIICNQLLHEKEFKVIKNDKEYKSYYENNIQRIRIPSLFHQNFHKEILNNLRIIDTPGIEKLEDIEVILNQVKQIVHENPYILTWILDYEQIFNSKIFSAVNGEQFHKNPTFLILNKIDKRTMQDQSLDKIYQKLNKKNIYQLSAKNIYSYNIMNFGTQQQKEQLMENYFLKQGSLMQLTRSTLANHCETNIKQNKNLVDQDYGLLITNLKQSIIHGYNDRIQELEQQQQLQLNFNITNYQIQLIISSITLIQQEQNKQVMEIEKNKNEIDLMDSNNWKEIESYFLQQNNNILELIDRITSINIKYQTKILKEIQFHIIGRNQIDDDELEVLESPEVEMEKKVISDYFQHIFHSQQSKLNLLNKYKLPLSSHYIESYQIQIDQFNAYITDYIAQKTMLKSKIMTCKQVIYPMLFLEFGVKITIGLLIISLTEALKIQNGQLDPLIDDQFQTFTKNYKLLTEKFINENVIYFNQYTQLIKDLIQSQQKY